jgi:hypothetical protein
MSKRHYGKQTGRPVTHEIPTPAGGVRLETFIPWRLVQRGPRNRSSRHWTRRRNSCLRPLGSGRRGRLGRIAR